VKIRTFTFQSFNWIFDIFFKNGQKTVPYNIGEYLSPLTLAVWIMYNGSYEKFGMLLHCEGFCPKDQKLLQEALFVKYGLKTTLHKKNNKTSIYVPKAHFLK
jgi:hypothetical protein